MKIAIVEEGPTVSRRILKVSDEWGSLDDALAAVKEPGDKWERLPRAIVVRTEEGGTVMLVDVAAHEKETGETLEKTLEQPELEPGAENTLRVTPLGVTPDFVRGVMQSAPLVSLTQNALNDLKLSLGSMDQVMAFLVGLATEFQKPIAVNTPTPTGSTTALIGPQGWGEERLQGWMGTSKAGFEAQFGKVAGKPYTPNREQRRKRGK
jgi:hypothetical protein